MRLIRGDSFFVFDGHLAVLRMVVRADVAQNLRPLCLCMNRGGA
jgi:hypothetical protein